MRSANMRYIQKGSLKAQKVSNLFTHLQFCSFSDFSKFREETLKNLLEGTGDKSRAGGVDEGILHIVQRINTHPLWCTTSSCSGRLLIFHRAGRTQRVAVEGQKISGLKRGVGGRGVLFESHSILPDQTLSSVAQNIWERTSEIAAAMTADNHYSSNCPVMEQSMVELLWSPMLLHVRCGDLGSAAQLVHAGTAAGFRRSGMMLSAGRQCRPMGDPLIRSSEISENIYVSSLSRSNCPQCIVAGSFGFNTPLALDNTVLVNGPVSIEALLQRANRLFHENIRRRAIFESHIDTYLAGLAQTKTIKKTAQCGKEKIEAVPVAE